MRPPYSTILVALVAIGALAARQVPATAESADVALNSPRQVIDGFGGSSAWSGALSDSVMDTLFGNGNNQQIGLSLLRVRIDPDQRWAEETSNARKAHARGAKVLGTPWTPPAAMKSNHNAIGGELNPDQYAAYARFLHTAGVSIGLDACSIQNEPDIKVSYESCTWGPAQLETFCRDDALEIGKPVVMPESYHFDDAFSAPTLADRVAASHVALVAGHIYGGGLAVHQDAITHGKHIWMTEHYINGSDIGTCCSIAKEISDCLENDMNAYIWWFMTWQGCRIIDNGALLKNGYTLGQFSKFIRPGYRRVEATYNPSPSVYVTGYTGPHWRVVVVAVNMGTSDVSQTFTFHGRKITRLTPTQTTATANLATLAAVPVMKNAWTATLPAQSITTFVN
ncbi:MAG: glucuronoxylanase XynC [Armatimonadetes bacterium]|nr:glucuronoxylanase XynC [Armatimonadota bacterium]